MCFLSQQKKNSGLQFSGECRLALLRLKEIYLYLGSGPELGENFHAHFQHLVENSVRLAEKFIAYWSGTDFFFMVSFLSTTLLPFAHFDNSTFLVGTEQVRANGRRYVIFRCYRTCWTLRHRSNLHAVLQGLVLTSKL